MRLYGVDYPNVRDPGNDVPSSYGATGVPETFFISSVSCRRASCATGSSQREPVNHLECDPGAPVDCRDEPAGTQHCQEKGTAGRQLQARRGRAHDHGRGCLDRLRVA